MVEAFVHEVRARNEARTGDEALPDRDPRDESLPDVVADVEFIFGETNDSTDDSSGSEDESFAADDTASSAGSTSSASPSQQEETR